MYFIYAMHARIAYINYTKKLRIFNILNLAMEQSYPERVSLKGNNNFLQMAKPSTCHFLLPGGDGRVVIVSDSIKS